MPATQNTTRETTLSITSQRTGVTFHVTARSASTVHGSFSLSIGMNRTGRAPVSATAHVDGTGVLQVSKGIRHGVGLNGHIEEDYIGADLQATLETGVAYMWAQMVADAKAAQRVRMLSTIADFRATGDADLAAKVSVVLAKMAA